MPALPTQTTGGEAGALTVAGQWRSFTAFPSILAIAVMSAPLPLREGSNDMEATSMSSTFIDGRGGEVKAWRSGNQGEIRNAQTRLAETGRKKEVELAEW
jgi:hypothetical protein